MTAHTCNTIAAAQLLAERAAPLLKAWDDVCQHSDILAGLLDKDDRHPAAEIVRAVREALSTSATAIEVGLTLVRQRVATDTNMHASELPTVEWLLVNGERQ